MLFRSAVASAPWDGLTAIGVLWGLLGLAGIAYSVIVTRRLRTQTVYKPVCEDWLFRVLVPLAAYTALAVSAGIAHSRGHLDLFLVAGAALLLLFIGIHNAWDTVTYHVFVRRREQRDAEQAGNPKE